jgi:hypothetical protein
VYVPLTARRGDRLVRKAAASLFLSVASVDEPEDFVTDVNDAMEAYERAFAAQWAINAGHSQAG